MSSVDSYTSFDSKESPDDDTGQQPRDGWGSSDSASELDIDFANDQFSTASFTTIEEIQVHRIIYIYIY